jgi:predicted RNase H-like nuclease (RuvC/YqgF family)
VTTVEFHNMSLSSELEHAEGALTRFGTQMESAQERIKEQESKIQILQTKLNEVFEKIRNEKEWVKNKKVQLRQRVDDLHAKPWQALDRATQRLSAAAALQFVEANEKEVSGVGMMEITDQGWKTDADWNTRQWKASYPRRGADEGRK